MTAKVLNIIKILQPVVIMVVVQISLAGVNILSKLASIDGMSSSILVAYRLLFAAASTVPLAFYMDRTIKPRPMLTWTVIGQAFLCGLLGGSLLLNMYMQSLVLTSVTFVAAMSNLLPVITFILAICFRLEKVLLTKAPGSMKIVGTILGIGGAMLMTFYKGIEIKLWSTNIQLYAHESTSTNKQDRVLGTLIALGSCLSFATWLIVQAKLSKIYPNPYSTTAMMNVMGSLQAILFALFADHDWQHWKLGWDIRLVTVSVSGMIGSGLMVALMAWCNRTKGPLFVSIFSPVCLVVVTLVGTLILGDKLYLGSVLGSIVIVLGLYAVVWAKSKEKESIQCIEEKEQGIV
ncbi:hypothetical protein RDABS01_005756 [Bienertia sinuspersici]